MTLTGSNEYCKVINKRPNGNLFHYAHFICDCLFPEIINEIYKYKEVFRQKTFSQTIGNFDKIYTDVMNINHTEIVKPIFEDLNVIEIKYKTKKQLATKKNFDKFRNFIFSRYEINHMQYNNTYPEILLIKRGGRIKLLSDKDLNKLNSLTLATGKERREIADIDEVERHLKGTYKHKFESVFLETISFKEQVNYFNNAKMIICAHGAAMSNMFFCKERTIIIEVTCNRQWGFFNIISRTLKLNHIKCVNNEYDDIIDCIKANSP
jgi:hypothetical protein